jgi:hypothetical protein
MLWSVSPNISIITNWGCRANCWYCIWKGHKLEHIQLETDWDKLNKFLIDNKEKGKVSVSGDGDCLYRYKEHKKWWEGLFEITNKLNMKIDIHTREKFINDLFWKKINKCVFSSDKLIDDKEYLKYLSDLTKIRVTHLVTANTNFKTINEYIKFQNKINYQFTIKELIGYNDNNMYKKVRKKYPQIYFLDKGDYNIYYMPDNTIQTKFLF